jgi:hypothetical protein
MPLFDVRLWVPVWTQIMLSPWLEWQALFLPQTPSKVAEPSLHDEMSVAPVFKKAA